MSADWERLLDEIQVEWRDRGANTSRKSVNIACPWCGDDPSFHLRIIRDNGGCYCLRDQRHKSSNPLQWLWRLGISRQDGAALLKKFSRGTKPIEREYTSFVPKKMQSKWDKFTPATENNRYVNYLKGRGFPDAERVIGTYDLRFADVGIWAQRLLIPYVQNKEVIGWTGRAIRPNLIPKYKMQDDLGEAIYMPERVRRCAILLEGQIDSLKVAASLTYEECSPLGIGGLNLSASKIVQLQTICRDCDGLLLAVDSGVPLGQSLAMLSEFTAVLPGRPVLRAKLPPDRKDAGEMPYDEIRDWIRQSLLQFKFI